MLPEWAQPLQRAHPVSLHQQIIVSLHQQIITQIEQAIGAGALVAGDHLSTEPQLAHDWNVARATLRLALRRLADRGLVVRRRGWGTRIAPVAAVGPPRPPAPTVQEEIEALGARVTTLQEELEELRALVARQNAASAPHADRGRRRQRPVR